MADRRPHVGAQPSSGVGEEGSGNGCASALPVANNIASERLFKTRPNCAVVVLLTAYSNNISSERASQACSRKTKPEHLERVTNADVVRRPHQTERTDELTKSSVYVDESTDD